MTQTSGTGTAAEAPDLVVVRRDGSIAPFDPTRISVTLRQAFVATEG